MKKLVLCFVAFFAVAVSAQQCPENSVGKYPVCKCLNGANYDSKYNWCSSDLNELHGQCPQDGPGIYPNCNCGVGLKFDVVKNVCTAIDRSVCPKGAYGDAPQCQCPPTFAFDQVHWFCRPWYLSTTHKPQTYSPPPPSCGAYQYGTYPDCHYKPCPSHALNPQDFEPHCRYNITVVVYKPCPHGEVGHPPNCYKPCPPNYRGKYPDCERIRCPTGEGWSGEYQPDCKYTPSCPPEFPGVWPNCDIYKATTPRPNNTPIFSAEKSQPIPRRINPTTGPTYLPPTTQGRAIPPQTTTTTKKPTTQAPTYLPPTTQGRLIPPQTTTTTTKKPTTQAPTYLPPTTQGRIIPPTTTTTKKPTTQAPTYLPPARSFKFV